MAKTSEDISPIEQAEHELATIEYDYRLHPEATRRILALFKELVKDRS